jgi:outer membrane lipoprotein-sorting protein
MKGEKYKLDFRNSVIYYNGKTMWSYLKEVNEVNISEPAENPDNQDIMNHPNQIFELYEQDFKYKYKGTESKNNHNLYVVDLFPKDLDKDYSRIKLKVEQENYRIHSAKVFGKDGSRYTFIINKLTTNKPIKNSTFEFDKSAHPDVEVIDMRF